MYTQILVPIDGSRAAQRGLHEAVALASALGSRLVLLNVLDDQAELSGRASAWQLEQGRQSARVLAEALLQRAAQAAAEAGVPAARVLRDAHGKPAADVILDEVAAQCCQAIVMGTHGRRGLTRMAVGSDAEAVLRQARVPVLLVRAPD